MRAGFGVDSAIGAVSLRLRLLAAADDAKPAAAAAAAAAAAEGISNRTGCTFSSSAAFMRDTSGSLYDAESLAKRSFCCLFCMNRENGVVACASLGCLRGVKSVFEPKPGLSKFE